MTKAEQEAAGNAFRTEMGKVYNMFNRTLELIKEVHIEKYTQEEYRLIIGQIYLEMLNNEQKNR